MGQVKPDKCEHCSSVKGSCPLCGRMVGLDDHLRLRAHRNNENKSCGGATGMPKITYWPKIKPAEPKEMRRIDLDAVAAS